MGAKMEGQVQNQKPSEEEGEKIDITFSFIFKKNGNVSVKIDIPGLYTIKTEIPDVSYDLKAEARRLLRLENTIPLIERNFSTETVVKAMYLELAKMLLGVMEY